MSVHHHHHHLAVKALACSGLIHPSFFKGRFRFLNPCGFYIVDILASLPLCILSKR
jgi:hypothetical protein